MVIILSLILYLFRGGVVLGDPLVVAAAFVIGKHCSYFHPNLHKLHRVTALLLYIHCSLLRPSARHLLFISLLVAGHPGTSILMLRFHTADNWKGIPKFIVIINIFYFICISCPLTVNTDNSRLYLHNIAWRNILFEEYLCCMSKTISVLMLFFIIFKICSY